MKPWRPYWKHLEEIEDKLLSYAGPTPFGPLKNSAKWIGNLTYLQLGHCDSRIETMLRLLHTDWGRFPSPADPVENWQMILRVECALSFCKGRLWKRNKYDWEKPKEEVYRWLLIDLWYQDATYWAYRTFGSNDRKEESDIRKKLWQLSTPKDLESN